MNDYPADPPRETITDGSRIYPGDGVAPSALHDLHDIGFRGVLSLELFNRDYWKQDAWRSPGSDWRRWGTVAAKALA